MFVSKNLFISKHLHLLGEICEFSLESVMLFTAKQYMNKLHVYTHISLPILIHCRYNPQDDTWEFVEPMHVCRGGVGLAALGGYLFAIGGHDGKTYLNTAEMYCPKSNSWRMVASMKTSRAGAGVVACPVTSLNLNLSASSGSIPESLGSL